MESASNVLTSRYPGVNVNDNERVYKPFNDNDNETGKRVDDLARCLVQTFSSPASHDFYCLVAWKLPRTTIDRLVVQAKEKGRNPGALFNYLARKEMQ